MGYVFGNADPRKNEKSSEELYEVVMVISYLEEYGLPVSCPKCKIKVFLVGSSDGGWSVVVHCFNIIIPDNPIMIALQFGVTAQFPQNRRIPAEPVPRTTLRTMFTLPLSGAWNAG